MLVWWAANVRWAGYRAADVVEVVELLRIGGAAITDRDRELATQAGNAKVAAALQGWQATGWEGGVAVGFAALLYIGPVWIAQLVLTVLATIDDAGIAAGWLWAWLFAAPAIGISPPATGLVRLLRRGRPGVD
ncbi:hypothetical protein [Antrihabitans spumae]|uniref:Uncharacterized protein n=1 Tax=Antrihabitans spumae TaxID=3373370 RepID=A0ABW7KI90_9NOCA